MSSATFATAIAQAVSFLTRPLAASYSPSTVLALQLAAERSLLDFCAGRGPARRHTLALAPGPHAPRALHPACAAAGVSWARWLAALGGAPFELMLEPARVSVCFAGAAPVAVWSAALERAAHAEAEARLHALQSAAYVHAQTRAADAMTLAQQLAEVDAAADDELFALIDDEVHGPRTCGAVDAAWLGATLAQFPGVPAAAGLAVPAAPRSNAYVPPARRSPSPASAASGHSRSSSFSSLSSMSGASFSDVSDAASVCSSSSSTTHSRRERARLARVHVDTTKTDVTPYDGGKTTVLTGGVMLGAKPTPAPQRAPYIVAAPTAAAQNWRLSAQGRF